MCWRATAPIRSCCAFRPERPTSRKSRCRSQGHVDEVFTDPRVAGRDDRTCPAGYVPTGMYAYRSRGQVVLRSEDRRAWRHRSRPSYVVSDLSAKAQDGVMVPLSLVQPKDAKGAQITIVEAYGSYGISELADFTVRRAAAMRQGITYGVCHVRGGGELGEAWRLGGKDANKHNTWDDLIACGEYVIARGITTKDKLFIIGGSAGGITMGRSLTERPDLFAGVIDLVPAGNTLRSEFSPNGPPNIPEFGTVTTADGFKNLYEMDTIRHVKKGTAVSGGDGGDGSQRSARFAVGTGEGRRRIAGVGNSKAGAAAHRRGGRPRHRFDQDADRRAHRRLDRVRVLARRFAGMAAEALNRVSAQDSYLTPQP